MLKLRLSGNDRVKDYADKFKVKFYSEKRPWVIPCDIAFPCATQNELDLDDAKALVKNNVKCLVEGANLPVTLEGMEFLENADIFYAPAKACNAGGVACSCFEMAQNASFMNWTKEEVDMRLHQVMKHPASLIKRVITYSEQMLQGSGGLQMPCWTRDYLDLY